MFSTIKLCKLIEEKTVIESSELFEKSAFKFVYQKTKSLIEKIVSKEDANISELQEDQSIQELQIDNIISFEGRRGTGKTSVMTSVCKALKKNKQTKFIKKQDSREPEFIVLDFIDASMLETGEDILDIILANMFLKLKGVVSECDSYNRGYHHEIEYEVRELYKLFDEIYDNLRKSKNMERYKNTGSPLNSLNNLSNSQILKIKIFKLIQVYLKYMETQKYVGQKAFLVISVDDLDMYFQTKDSSPFEVLETLHRYFMIPGVIILLTYNYQDLSIGCQKHFYQNYHDAIITGKNIEEIEKSVQKWTEQYLKKVLPIQTRIYMPSLKKSDYDDENNIKIELTKKELDKLLEDCDNAEIILKKEEFQEDKILFSTKRFALILKVSVANLYYDAVGQKKHFIEPTTIRELAQSYMVVRQLQSMYKKIEYEATTDEAENMLFKELLDDIYFRYAKVKLSDEEEQRFSNYLDVPIERRTKDILRDIEDFVNKENSTIDITISEIVGESLRKEKYSYGELLYYLYKARRAGIFSKELVCCILDSYTVVLTKFYRRLKELPV